jgi:hypothetical protein
MSLPLVLLAICAAWLVGVGVSGLRGVPAPYTPLGDFLYYAYVPVAGVLFVAAFVVAVFA